MFREQSIWSSDWLAIGGREGMVQEVFRDAGVPASVDGGMIHLGKEYESKGKYRLFWSYDNELGL